jgi:hypothetical protein
MCAYNSAVNCLGRAGIRIPWVDPLPPSCISGVCSICTSWSGSAIFWLYRSRTFYLKNLNNYKFLLISANIANASMDRNPINISIKIKSRFAGSGSGTPVPVVGLILYIALIRYSGTSFSLKSERIHVCHLWHGKWAAFRSFFSFMPNVGSKLVIICLWKVLKGNYMYW